MRRAIALAAGVIVLAGAGIGTLALTNETVVQTLPAAPNMDSARTVISACGTNTQDQKAQCLVTASITVFDAIGSMPQVLTEVENQISSNPDLRGVNCHGTFHEIGKIAHARLGDQALANGVPLCSGGYYHGVLQAGGNIDQARELCSTLTDDIARADCMHGAGHAAYLDDPTLAHAQEFCKGDKYDACLAGFFMELAGANQRDTAALAYCAEPGIDQATLGACYNGLLSDIAIGNPQDVQQWCQENAVTADQLPDTCWSELGSGVGSGVNERQPTNDQAAVSEVIDLCNENSHCLTSAAYVLRSFFNRDTVANSLCSQAGQSSALGRYPDACPNADPR